MGRRLSLLTWLHVSLPLLLLLVMLLLLLLLQHPHAEQGVPLHAPQPLWGTVVRWWRRGGC